MPIQEKLTVKNGGHLLAREDGRMVLTMEDRLAGRLGFPEGSRYAYSVRPGENRDRWGVVTFITSRRKGNGRGKVGRKSERNIFELQGWRANKHTAVDVDIEMIDNDSFRFLIPASFLPRGMDKFPEPTPSRAISRIPADLINQTELINDAEGGIDLILQNLSPAAQIYLISAILTDLEKD